MIFAIVALAVSFVVMTSMLIVKRYEINAGHNLVMVGPRIWCDKQMRRFVHTLQGMLQAASTKRFWTGLMSYTWLKFKQKIWHHPHVEKVTKKAVDVVKGKKEIKSNGPVSYYLKDVSDYKKDLSA